MVVRIFVLSKDVADRILNRAVIICFNELSELRALDRVGTNGRQTMNRHLLLTLIQTHSFKTFEINQQTKTAVAVRIQGHGVVDSFVF